MKLKVKRARRMRGSFFIGGSFARLEYYLSVLIK
jgi:hypothetical protein